MAERKNPQLDAQHQAILKRMMQNPENKTCGDCHGPYPRWASTNLGIFVCMSCSGIHRKLGTHISQVRSVTLDTWTPSQIAHFTKLGNAKAARYFEACLPANFSRPHGSDNMRMEAFIRDKYEHRRYITVENGGLGGATQTRPTASTARLSYSHSNQRPATSRPHHSSYDHSNSRPLASTSFAARFSHPRPNQQPPRPAMSAPRGPRGPPVDPIARASVLRELVNMGFDTQLALRAVEAGQGSLQPAVDWLLENAAKSQQHNVQPAPRPASAERDLLDFGDPSPPQPSAPPSAPVPKPAPKPAPTYVADFADFGEFESALPNSASAPKATVSTAYAAPTSKSPPPSTKTLTSSLADLYKQKPKANSVSPKSPALSSKITVNGTSPLGPAGIAPLQKAAKSPSAKPGADGIDVGLPFIDLKDTNRQQMANIAKQSTSTIPPPAVQPKGNAAGNNVKQTQEKPQSSPTKATSSKTPESAFSPLSASPSQPSGKADEVATEDVKTEGADSRGSEAQNVEGDRAVKEGEKEEEDPFAALSMMAFSSSSVRKRKTEELGAPRAEAGSALDAGGKVETAAVGGMSTLDDLLA